MFDIIILLIILFLVVIIGLLAIVLFMHMSKSTYMTTKEKEFLIFVIGIYSEYADELGVQSKDQHVKLVEELNKIKTKHLKNE